MENDRLEAAFYLTGEVLALFTVRGRSYTMSRCWKGRGGGEEGARRGRGGSVWRNVTEYY